MIPSAIVISVLRLTVRTCRFRSGRQSVSADRLLKRMVLTGAMLAMSVAAWGATYYVDYVSGSNSNDGTSKQAAWKCHPYMRGEACSPSAFYVHAGGDHFVFRGGVTWPNAALPLVVNANGRSDARDYYGVDSSWFDPSVCGAGFCRPIFDRQNNQGTLIDIGGHGNLTIDSIELRNQHYAGVTGFCDGGLVGGGSSVTNVTIQNIYLHDWSGITPPNDGPNNGGICFSSTGSNVRIKNSTIAGQIGNRTGGAIWGGYGVAEVSGTTVHDVSNGVLMPGILADVHDNEFYNIRNSIGGTHSNVYEAGATSHFYNNHIHDSSVAVYLFICPNTGETPDLIYNNVLWNIPETFPIQIDANCGNGSVSVSRIYNNTIVANGGAVVRMNGRTDTLGMLVVQNNHFINTYGTGVCADISPSCEAVSRLIVDHNVIQTSSQAAAEGYTANSRFRSAYGSTVAAGVNLSDQNISSLNSDILTAQRPQVEPWDVGAYQTGKSTSSVNTPGQRTATVR